MSKENLQKTQVDKSVNVEDINSNTPPKEVVVNILGYKVICRTCDIEMDFDEIARDYVKRNFINI